MIEQTLILIKPDGVARGLTGEIIKRFEQRGLKIIGLKMVEATNDIAKKHYTDDIVQRRGQHIYDWLLEYITEGPVIAIAVQGVNAIENVRKLVGATESKSALPGTIRGDYSHMSFHYADSNNKILRNLIHASSDSEDAKRELALWFSVNEIHDYKRCGEEHFS